MKDFKYERAQSFEDADKILKSNEKACPLAGGTDLLGTLKNEILCEDPEMLVDLKSCLLYTSHAAASPVQRGR